MADYSNMKTGSRSRDDGWERRLARCVAKTAADDYRLAKGALLAGDDPEFAQKVVDITERFFLCGWFPRNYGVDIGRKILDILDEEDFLKSYNERRFNALRKCYDFRDTRPLREMYLSDVKPYEGEIARRLSEGEPVFEAAGCVTEGKYYRCLKGVPEFKKLVDDARRANKERKEKDAREFRKKMGTINEECVRKDFADGKKFDAVAKKNGLTIDELEKFCKKRNISASLFMNRYDKDIKKFALCGEYAGDIAKRLNLPENAVVSYMRSLGLDVKVREASCLDGEEENIKQALSRGEAIKEIADGYGVSESLVSRFIRRHGLR